MKKISKAAGFGRQGPGAWDKQNRDSIGYQPALCNSKSKCGKSDGTIEVEEIRGEDLKVVEEGVFKPYDEKDIDIDMDELKELED